jgi:hypothetical protein
MMVHSRVRCFQSLPAPSPAIEADHYHCKPVPSRDGDMGSLTKSILVPGGLVCARGDDRIVTVLVVEEESCKRNCKRTTRHRTVSGITGRHRHGKIGELERTVSYQTTRGSTRVFKLENRCAGNRTMGSNPTLSVPVPWFSTGCGGFLICPPTCPPKIKCGACNRLKDRMGHYGTGGE